MDVFVQMKTFKSFQAVVFKLQGVSKLPGRERHMVLDKKQIPRPRA